MKNHAVPGNLTTRLPNSCSCHCMCPAPGRSNVINQVWQGSWGKALAPTILLLTCWHEVMLQLASTCSVYFALFCILVKELPYAQGGQMAPWSFRCKPGIHHQAFVHDCQFWVSHSIQPAYVAELGVEFAHISPTCLSPSLPSWRWCRVDQCRRSIAKNHKP